MSEFDDFEDLEIEIEEEEEEVTTPKAKVPRAPSGQRINLFFRSTIGPSEKIEKLTVDSSMAVRELKQTVSQIFGLDPQDFHLSVAGRTIDTDDVLDNYDVTDGEEVLIIPVSTAG